MSIKLPICCMQNDMQLRFGLLLHEVTKAWRAAIDDEMRPLGLSSAQLTVICSLAGSDRPLTQRELAETMNVESPSIVRLLDRLEAKGWVKRVQSPKDRRVKHVMLTDKGLPYFDQLVRVAQKLEAELMAGIPNDKVRTAVEVLCQVRKRLGADPAHED